VASTLNILYLKHRPSGEKQASVPVSVFTMNELIVKQKEDTAFGIFTDVTINV